MYYYGSIKIVLVVVVVVVVVVVALAAISTGILLSEGGRLFIRPLLEQKDDVEIAASE